jgi:hypothetical protein
MADFDAALVQQVLHIPKRKREPDVGHDRQADGLRTGFEVAKWGAFCHSTTAGNRPARFKTVSSDSAADAICPPYAHETPALPRRPCSTIRSHSEG